MKSSGCALMGLTGLLFAGCASRMPLPAAAGATTVPPTSAPIPSRAASTDARTDVLTVGPPTVAPTVTRRAPPAPTVALTATRPAPTATPWVALSEITITVLYDNLAGDGRLETGWGFSCLVEGPEKTILFDTGGDGAVLLRNARTLGSAVQDVDAVVISHVHGDHVGGLAGFLEENPDVTVYVPQSFPVSIKAVPERAGAELVELGGSVEICRHVHSTGEIGNGIVERCCW